jgi:hypothetical protein
VGEGGVVDGDHGWDIIYRSLEEGVLRLSEGVHCLESPVMINYEIKLTDDVILLYFWRY